jgi:hypothetical protein
MTTKWEATVRAIKERTRRKRKNLETINMGKMTRLLMLRNKW